MKIQAIVLDMDGVLWRGPEPLGDLPALFDRLNALGLKIALATNNATRTPADYVKKLASFGVQIQPSQVMTSALATALLLQERLPAGSQVYAVGQHGLIQALNEAGFQVVPVDVPPEKVDAVVAGMDRTLTYEKLLHAVLLIRRGAPFYGSNPDRTYPTPQGQAPGAGAILAAIEAATGVQPQIAGKPEAHIFRLALQKLNVHPEEALMVGDRLETDILGGQRAGMRTALVLSGVTAPDQAAAWSPPPDWIVPDLTSLVDTLESA